MNYHNHREYTLLENNISPCKPLEGSINSDYLIIWWWVAWLHAALELIKQWVKPSDIALVEKTICGWGMSGKSGGFLTPDSELGLRSVEKRFGKDIAKKVREFGAAGQASIVSNVNQYKFHCDLRNQDSLLLGLGKSGINACKEEAQAREEYGYESELILETDHLMTHNSWAIYSAWIKYEDCFGIDAFQYCQSLKQHLINQWVNIFEFTEIDNLKETQATTNCWSISFKHCFICPGKVTNTLSKSKAKLLFGIMNFITVSEPLESSQIHAMMPRWECMCRDTKLVFNYYRVIDGNRIVLWWGNTLSAFRPREVQYETAISNTVHDFKKMFPSLKGVKFNEYRSGRIQVTKDLMPIIDTCDEHCNHTRVMWCAWLPRAAACWEFAVKKHFGNHDAVLDQVFSIHRKRFISRTPASDFLKSFLFAISNARAMFRQKGY